MTQNRSHAVMAQRFESRESLDDFPTPPWATRALLTHVIGEPWRWSPRHPRHCWEPACNRGFMVRALRERFTEVYASDIADYGMPGAQVIDFLAPINTPPWPRLIDWIITNPPFKKAEEFAHRAIDLTENGVALLVRLQWLEGKGRYERLFKRCPPTIIAQFAERVPMIRGACDPEAGTATAYCWVVFQPGNESGTRFEWIPPCRDQLERPGDYEVPT